MKKLLASLLTFAAIVTTTSAQDFLQDPRYGNSPEERTENVKLLNAFKYSYNIKDYPVATAELKLLLQRAPKSSENLYVQGINIYLDMIANAKHEDVRNKCLDSILIIYDLRAKNFENHATRGKDYVLTQKALTFNSYTGTEQDRIRALGLFQEAIEAGRHNMGDDDVELIGTYFKNVTNSFLDDEITLDDYVARYEAQMAMLNEANNQFSRKVAVDVEAMFAGSGAANCDNIEKIFKPKYEANPNDASMVKKILALMSKAKCNTPFTFSVLETYYKTEPTPDVAFMLAGAYEEKGDMEKATEFLQFALANEKDATIKASHLVRMAGQALNAGRSKDAYDLARQALEVESSNSNAAFLVASSMLSGINGCSGENKQYAIWLVYDAYSRAISMMSNDDPMRAGAQQAAGSLAANFPKKEDLFMMGLTEGAGHSVSCGWVSGRTTVRGR